MNMKLNARALIVLSLLTVASTATFAQERNVTPINETAVQTPVPARFDGHQVIRANLVSQAQLDAMLEIAPDVWSDAIGIGPVDFRVAPERMAEVDRLGIEYEVLIPDVQVLIDAERVALEDQKTDAGWFDNYKTYSEVMDYLDGLSALRPDLAEVIDIGDSVQGRSIKAIRITGPNGGGKPGVLYNGCQHAREWITVMTVMYMADRLVNTYDSDPEVQALLDTTEFYFIPIVNPDGYSYTWTNYRLWRKNRRPGGGVDLNRNWAYGWGGPGTSDDPASQIYRGPAPFSEPETQVVRDFVIERPTIIYHNDVHSYSQLVLWPWGFTRDRCEDYDTFDAIGQNMVDAIYDVHQMTYRQGPIFTTIYPASGVMSDWMYGSRFAFSVSYELRDRGDYGFILPPDQIIPTGEEAFAGMVTHVTSGVNPRSMLDAAGDLVWGGDITLTASRSTPGAAVRFYMSFIGIKPPGTYIPDFNITLDLFRAKLLGTDVADASGLAQLSRNIPAWDRDRQRFFFQAAEAGSKTNYELVDIDRP